MFTVFTFASLHYLHRTIRKKHKSVHSSGHSLSGRNLLLGCPECELKPEKESWKQSGASGDSHKWAKQYNELEIPPECHVMDGGAEKVTTHLKSCVVGFCSPSQSL